MKQPTRLSSRLVAATGPGRRSESISVRPTIVVACAAVRPLTNNQLTFMSIAWSIEDAISAGHLRVFMSEFDSDELIRSILLHPQLEAQIYERAEEWGRRVGRLQGDFESFVRGQHIALSMTPFEHKSAFMGLMHPPADGTWEIRSRDPKPGLRVFGKFPCADTFVALSWEPRSVHFGEKRPLGGRYSLEYQLALIETNDLWKTALPDVVPLTGGTYRDYVSENSSEV